MDSIKKEEKLRAIKYYNYKRGELVLVSNLVFHSLIAVMTCSFLCSYPFWFSYQSSSTNYFLFIFLPKFWTSFLSPKCLFVVVNIIVIFLLGESKLLGSNSSQDIDIYTKYVERSRELRLSKVQEKKEVNKLEIKLNEDSGKRVDHECKEFICVEVPKEEDFKKSGNTIISDEQHDRDGADQESEFSDEEINRRAEEFIARVNKRRWLEARALVCL